MKRNRTQALGFILDHRKKVLKGLTALLQILEKLPAGVSVGELVAAGKAASKKAEQLKKAKAKSKKTKSKSSAKSKAAAQPAEQGQPPVDEALM